MITFKQHKKRIGYVKYDGAVMTLHEALKRTPPNTKILFERLGIVPDEVLLHIHNGKYKILETLGEWGRLEV